MPTGIVARMIIQAASGPRCGPQFPDRGEKPPTILTQYHRSRWSARSRSQHAARRRRPDKATQRATFGHGPGPADDRRISTFWPRLETGNILVTPGRGRRRPPPGGRVGHPRPLTEDRCGAPRPRLRRTRSCSAGGTPRWHTRIHQFLPHCRASKDVSILLQDEKRLRRWPYRKRPRGWPHGTRAPWWPHGRRPAWAVQIPGPCLTARRALSAARPARNGAPRVRWKRRSSRSCARPTAP